MLLPGLNRRDEIGRMARAVEEFKVQAVAKANHDAEKQRDDARVHADARRTELAAFADQFEVAVGSIVSTVSSSAHQLENYAGSLARTTEMMQRLASQVTGASEHSSSNVQSVASATEELSMSVNEIGRQVQESNRIARQAESQAQQTDQRIGRLSLAAQKIGEVVRMISAIASTGVGVWETRLRSRP